MLRLCSIVFSLVLFALPFFGGKLVGVEKKLASNFEFRTENSLDRLYFICVWLCFRCFHLCFPPAPSYRPILKNNFQIWVWTITNISYSWCFVCVPLCLGPGNVAFVSVYLYDTYVFISSPLSDYILQLFLYVSCTVTFSPCERIILPSASLFFWSQWQIGRKRIFKLMVMCGLVSWKKSRRSGEGPTVPPS